MDSNLRKDSEKARRRNEVTEPRYNIFMLAMLLFGVFVILPFVIVAGLYGGNHPKADLLLNALLIYMFVLLTICIAA